MILLYIIAAMEGEPRRLGACLSLLNLGKAKNGRTVRDVEKSSFGTEGCIVARRRECTD